MFGLTGLLEHVATLVAEDRNGWSGAARAAHLQGWAALREAVEVGYLDAMADWDRDHSWADDGAASAPAWLVANTRCGTVDAAGSVASARLARTHARSGRHSSPATSRPATFG